LLLLVFKPTTHFFKLLLGGSINLQEFTLSLDELIQTRKQKFDEGNEKLEKFWFNYT
jgi:hypothetical protein